MNRMTGILVAIVLGFSLHLNAQDLDRQKREIEAALMCQCGCSLSVRDCNHADCGFAVPEKKKIAQMLAEGKTKEEIIDDYVATFGESILSSPPKTNLFAWVTPFVIGLVALWILINYLRQRPGEVRLSAARTKDAKVPYDEQIEQELKEMD